MNFILKYSKIASKLFEITHFKRVVLPLWVLGNFFLNFIVNFFPNQWIKKSSWFFFIILFYWKQTNDKIKKNKTIKIKWHMKKNI